MAQNSGSSLVFFVLGIAVGAVVSALYVPVSGPALRKRLGEVADEGADMAEDAMDQAEEFVRDKSKAAKKVVNSSVDAFRKVRNEAVNAAE